jgi:tetratricopeptide (TPR) repeat protein
MRGVVCVLDKTKGTFSIAELKNELSRLEGLVNTPEADKLHELIGDQLTLWEQIVRRDSDYDTAFRIGELLETVRLHWLAIAWYQWVVGSTGAEKDDQERRRKALLSKARVFIKLRMYHEALSLLLYVEEHLTSNIDSEEWSEWHTLLHNTALTYGQLENYELALAYATRALRLVEKSGNTHAVRTTKLMIGSFLAKLNRFEESFAYLTKACEEFERCQDHFHLARSWHNYAELMKSWGRKEEALAAWRMSLEIKKRTHDYDGQVNTFLSITDHLLDQEDWHGALRYVTQAFPICHQHRLHDLEVLCLDRWATIAFELKRKSDLEVVVTRATYLGENVSAKVTHLLDKVACYFDQLGLAEKGRQEAVQNM